MPRGHKKATGDSGEELVANTAPCPACGKALRLLPESYPLYDVQCSACLFRCQVKTTAGSPKSTIPGAGWQILNGALRTGQQVPPLVYVANVGEAAKEDPVIRFFPFIPKSHLKRREAFTSKKSSRSPHKMFSYTRMDLLPSFVLNDKGRWQPDGPTE